MKYITEATVVKAGRAYWQGWFPKACHLGRKVGRYFSLENNRYNRYIRKYFCPSKQATRPSSLLESRFLTPVWCASLTPPKRCYLNTHHIFTPQTVLI
jgi:hypothetical protein